MRLSFKPIGLLTGVVLTFVSFLFFGRQQGTYQILNICGHVTALIFYVTILFGKNHLKTKVFWSVALVLGAVVQQLTAPFLINTSYRIYISQNKNILTEINYILINKHGEITILKDSIFKSDQLTVLESEKLREGQKKLVVYKHLRTVFFFQTQPSNKQVICFDFEKTIHYLKFSTYFC